MIKHKKKIASDMLSRPHVYNDVDALDDNFDVDYDDNDEVQGVDWV